jgi:hypothetical protein
LCLQFRKHKTGEVPVNKISLVGSSDESVDSVAKAKADLLTPLRESLPLPVFYGLDMLGTARRNRPEDIQNVRALLGGDILARLVPAPGGGFLLAMAGLAEFGPVMAALAKATCVIWWLDQNGQSRPRMLRNYYRDGPQVVVELLCRFPWPYRLEQRYMALTDMPCEQSRMSVLSSYQVDVGGCNFHPPGAETDELSDQRAGLTSSFLAADMCPSGRLRQIAWHISPTSAQWYGLGKGG